MRNPFKKNWKVVGIPVDKGDVVIFEVQRFWRKSRAIALVGSLKRHPSTYQDTYEVRSV